MYDMSLTILIDILIGDWDRHVDQWRWAQFKDKENDKIISHMFLYVLCCQINIFKYNS